MPWLPTTPSAALLLAAAALSAVIGLPQAVRLWRTRDVTGVAPSQDLLRVVTKLAWVAYALAHADPGLAAAQLIALPSVLTVLLLCRAGALRLRQLLTTAVVAAAVVTGTLLTGAVALLGSLATLSDIGRYLPQAATTLHTDDLSGVAPGTYLAQIAASACWGGYGALQGLPPLVWGNLVIAPVAALILIRVVAAHRRTSRPAPPPAAQGSKCEV